MFVFKIINALHLFCLIVFLFYFRPLLENTAANNFVVAANETNEIFISFKEGSESKVFTFDKVFYEDISQVIYTLISTQWQKHRNTET